MIESGFPLFILWNRFGSLHDKEKKCGSWEGPCWEPMALKLINSTISFTEEYRALDFNIVLAQNFLRSPLKSSFFQPGVFLLVEGWTGSSQGSSSPALHHLHPHWSSLSRSERKSQESLVRSQKDGWKLRTGDTDLQEVSRLRHASILTDVDQDPPDFLHEAGYLGHTIINPE